MGEALKDPEVVLTDFGKFEQPYQYHICYLALSEFLKEEGRYPKPYNKEDGEKFVTACKAANEAHSLGLEVTQNIFLWDPFKTSIS